MPDALTVCESPLVEAGPCEVFVLTSGVSVPLNSRRRSGRLARFWLTYAALRRVQAASAIGHPTAQQSPASTRSSSLFAIYRKPGSKSAFRLLSQGLVNGDTCSQIFQRCSNRFEKGDLLVGLASLLFLFRQFVQVGNDIVQADRPGLQGLNDVARFLAWLRRAYRRKPSNASRRHRRSHAYRV